MTINGCDGGVDHATWYEEEACDVKKKKKKKKNHFTP
jgi:hypothetical protein